MDGPPAGGGGALLGFFCFISTSAHSSYRLTFFFLINSTSSAGRVGAGGGGGGRPGGGAGRGSPFGVFVPFGVGRLGAEVGCGFVDALPFRCGLFASGLGAEEGGTSDGRFEGTTLGDWARSFWVSSAGAGRDALGPDGIGLDVLTLAPTEAGWV
jgi:hypothetical protein